MLVFVLDTVGVNPFTIPSLLLRAMHQLHFLVRKGELCILFLDSPYH